MKRKELTESLMVLFMEISNLRNSLGSPDLYESISAL